MSVTENLLQIKGDLPGNVKLIAVSKTMPPEVIKEAFDAGHIFFGENKAQEIIIKQPQLPDAIRWHFIGHLQTNKVKYIAPFVKCIESIDSLKLLKEVNKHAMQNDRIIDCLLQFHIAKEYSKYGIDIEEAKDIIESDTFSQMKHIRLTGVMGMATFTNDHTVIRDEFKTLYQIFSSLKMHYFSDIESFKDISMGMSNDYRIAIEEGSTMVRIGSLIFGDHK